MSPDRERWNEKHRRGDPHFRAVNPRLVAHAARLGPPGTAADLAMGVGQNAAWLEARGWRVVGVDLSDEALARAPLRWRLQADLAAVPLRPGAFDLALCTYFFDRTLLRALPALVRPGGTLFWETHDQAFRKYRPDFPAAYLPAPGELLSAVAGWELLHHERGDDGEHTWETVIARRPR